MAETPVPMVPRITKSTAVASIVARFPTTEALLQRFEVAKNQASLWDGERDGLREAVKKLEGAQYGHTILSWTKSAEVLYPNAAGKYQIESCLQTTASAIPLNDQGSERVDGSLNAGDPVIVFQFAGDAEDFTKAILHQLQKGKDQLLAFVMESCIGQGNLVKNTMLYEKKGSDKSQITVLPEV